MLGLNDALKHNLWYHDYKPNITTPNTTSSYAVYGTWVSYGDMSWALYIYIY
jgi:hypothetical protein